MNVLQNKDEGAGVRGNAAEALAGLQNKQAVPVLIQCLEDEAPEVRFWCSYALGELRDKRALPALEQLAMSDQTIVAGWGKISDEAQDAVKSIES